MSCYFKSIHHCWLVSLLWLIGFCKYLVNPVNPLAMKYRWWVANNTRIFKVLFQQGVEKPYQRQIGQQLTELFFFAFSVSRHFLPKKRDKSTGFEFKRLFLVTIFLPLSRQRTRVLVIWIRYSWKNFWNAQFNFLAEKNEILKK